MLGLSWMVTYGNIYIMDGHIWQYLQTVISTGSRSLVNNDQYNHVTQDIYERFQDILYEGLQELKLEILIQLQFPNFHMVMFSTQFVSSS